MDYEKKTKDLQKAFELLDKLCIICLKETDRETRIAIKQEIARRFEKARDDEERSIILTVQQYFKGMSYFDIYEMSIEAKKKKGYR